MVAAIDKPETPSQASTWEWYTGRYERAGLCRTCAGQAAYGHQHGFNQVGHPCARCAEVVTGLPIPKTNGWRALQIDPWRGIERRSEVGVSAQGYSDPAEASERS